MTLSAISFADTSEYPICESIACTSFAGITGITANLFVLLSRIQHFAPLSFGISPIHSALPITFCESCDCARYSPIFGISAYTISDFSAVYANVSFCLSVSLLFISSMSLFTVLPFSPLSFRAVRISSALPIFTLISSFFFALKRSIRRSSPPSVPYLYTAVSLLICLFRVLKYPVSSLPLTVLFTFPFTSYTGYFLSKSSSDLSVFPPFIILDSALLIRI